MKRRAFAARRVMPVLVATLMFMAGLPISSMAVQVEQPVVANPDPSDNTPQVLDGQVNAIIQMGDTVIVGGTFTQVRRVNNQTILDRPYVFAYDVDTGAIDPNFVPQLNNYVEALAPGPGGQSVFMGGNFTTVNGAAYKKVARVNLADGSLVTGFKANASALVLDVVANGPWLYVSGKFTKIKGVARSGLARLNPNTGAVDANLNLPFTDPERGTMGVPHIDVTPNGSKLVAIGSFSMVAGLPRSQIAVLDLTTSPATVSSWQTSLTPVYATPPTTWCASAFNTWMRDIDISPDGSYFILGTTGAFRANRLCDTLTRWDLTSAGPNQAPVWINATGGDTTWAVATTGHAIYVGGHFRWVNNPYRGDTAGPGAVVREGIAALDPLNGLPLSWDPTHERGIGIMDIVGTQDGVFMGSDTDHAGGEFHQKLALFPLAGGDALVPPETYGLPNDLYNIDDQGNNANGFLGRRSYNLTTFGADDTLATPGIDWRSARGAFAIDGRIYYGSTDGRIYWRTFNGTSAGSENPVPLNGLDVQPPSSFLIPGTTTRVPALTTQIANATGMFYDDGRIYYTVSGDNRLYYRYFTPESQTIGASLFVASTGDGVPWSTVRGMTMSDDTMLYATSDDRLYRVAWNGSAPTGPVVQVSGPGVDARQWSSRGLFVFD